MSCYFKLNAFLIAIAIKCESKVMLSLEVLFSEPLPLHYSFKSKIKNRLRFSFCPKGKIKTALCTQAYFQLTIN